MENGWRKLAKDSLTMGESTIMGIAGTAPAYSIEITTSTLIATVGMLAPANVLVCGIIMFGITYAFMNLNRISSNAGTSYAWVSMVFGKNLWFFAGWALLVLCCIFMVSAMVPAANATLLILKPELMNDVGWVTWIAALWLTFISLIVVKGIKLTSRVQVFMTVLEGIILFAVIAAGFYVFSKNPAHPFSWQWFNPLSFDLKTFAEGSLIAVFFYYGWDVTMNLSEETKNPEKTPGRAAFWSMVFLIAFFLVFITLIQLGLTDAEIQHYNTNVIFAVAEKVFGATWGYVAILAVLLSTVGTVETQILQFTRTIFAKGRDNALHPRYSKLHPVWKTPHVAIFIIWFFGVALLYASSYLPTINSILENSIAALGFQISFYLGLTGFACAWHFRKKIGMTWEAVTHVYWPAVSAAFLFFVAAYSANGFDLITNVIGWGGIAVGIVPLILNRMRMRKG